MNRSHRQSALVLTAATALLTVLLASCATPGRPGAADPAPAATLAPPPPPAGEVIAQGTVLDTGDDPQLCLGGVAESYPPQCTGLPLRGWDWESVEGSESSDGTTWGAYAVQGTFDGETMTVTAEPIMLALYDPMMIPDPTGGRPGTASEDTLAQLQEEIWERLGAQALTASAMDGRLWVDVVWDDGTLQSAVDADYGEDVVIVRSALRELAG
ncbi:hypothetical protein [Microbacterium aureliae]